MSKRIYHNYLLWEDYINGMWRTVNKNEEEPFLTKAISFTGNAELYGKYMLKVIKEWPISCEVNFTNPSTNHQAWVGHAACCIAIGCPEYITRQAWWQLTDRQRKEANLKADFAISSWEHKTEQNQWW